METLQDIWAELGTRLRAFVGRWVNDPHTADDITQDVLLKVQERLADVPPDDKLPAWLFAIARNAVTDHYRSRAVRAHVDLDGTAEPVAASDDGETERREAIRELAPCLERMVNQLPEPYREAMRLADFEGLGQEKIAERMGVSLSGAKSRVQRARHQLREMLLECCRITRDGRGAVVDFETTERSPRYCGGRETKDTDEGCGG